MNTLNCDIVRDLLPSYGEDLLHPSVRAAVSEHLIACPDCAAALEEQKKRIQTLQRQSAERDERFLRRAEELRAYRKGFARAFITSLVLTILAVVVLLAIYFLRMRFLLSLVH